MNKLKIELVPKTCWYSNVRSNVSKSEWNALRKECYVRADHKCEICGGKGDKHPVECHEIWHYDDDKHTQTLTGLIALCPMCHKSKHYGFAQVSGNEKKVRSHIKKVNGWTEDKLDSHIGEMFSQWNERSQHEWELDITFLDTYLNGDNDVDSLMNRLKNL